MPALNKQLDNLLVISEQLICAPQHSMSKIQGNCMVECLDGLPQAFCLLTGQRLLEHNRRALQMCCSFSPK